MKYVASNQSNRSNSPFTTAKHQGILRAMEALPKLVENMLDELSSRTEKIAEYLIQRLPRGPYILVGRGQHYATCLEGALKVLNGD